MLRKLRLDVALHEPFEAAGARWVLVYGSRGKGPIVVPEPLSKWGLELVARLVQRRAQEPQTTAQRDERVPAQRFDGEFILCLQPMFDVESRSVRRAEALLRYDIPDAPLLDWPHLTDGHAAVRVVGDHWTLGQLLSRTSRWRQRYGLGLVHVNVSVHDTSSLNALLTTFRRAAANERENFAVEFGGFADPSSPLLAQAARAFRQSGAAVGVELMELSASAMPALRALPLAFIKLPADEARYTATQTLPWDVCVTKLQSPPQWQQFGRAGIDYVQGYALEPPITVADFERRLELGFPARN